MRVGREKQQSSLGKCAGDSEEESEAACLFSMLHSWGVSLGRRQKRLACPVWYRTVDFEFLMAFPCSLDPLLAEFFREVQSFQ